MTDHTAALTYADALRIARGCTDYGGGYRGDAALFEVYQHGIQTVITALTHADPNDSQTRALMAMGDQSQQPAEPQEPRPRPSWLAGGEEAVAMAREDGLLGDEIERAGHATQQPAGWRPIETAPKDGTDVLLSGLRIGVGSFGICAKQQDGYRANGGEPCWRTDSRMKQFPNPTHWMPLPPAPGAHPSQQEDDAAMLDWLESQINEHGEIHLHDGNHPWGHGLGLRPGNLVRTLRQAINTAMTAAQGDAVQGGGE